MATYKVGFKGTLVVSIQTALSKAGFYRSIIDGVFGPVTMNAVKTFQKSVGLKVDGEVGPNTWAMLFAQPAVIPVAAAKPTVNNSVLTFTNTQVAVSLGNLTKSCLALVGSIETSRMAPGCFSTVSGNFDGELLSFGALQWNLGKGTLQPILRSLIINNSDIMSSIFGIELGALNNALTSHVAAEAFIKAIQKNGNTLQPDWKARFEALGATPECQAAQTNSTLSYYKHATELCMQYGIVSKRGRALMFDVCVQNGGISIASKNLIHQKFSTASDEVAKLKVIANVVASHSNPKYYNDVLSRKMCIANGKGVVHGARYDLAAQFGLDLTAA